MGFAHCVVLEHLHVILHQNIIHLAQMVIILEQIYVLHVLKLMLKHVLKKLLPNVHLDISLILTEILVELVQLMLIHVKMQVQ